MPLRESDIPTGVKYVPHPCGVGVMVDVSAMESRRAFALTPEAESLSEIYSMLRLGNGGGGFGPSGITWATIAGYQQAMGVKLDAWTLNLLWMVDGIYLKHAHEKIERDKRQAQRPTGS